MKSIINYISEKMVYSSDNLNKDIDSEDIISLMNKQDLIFIDRYDNCLLVNDVRFCGKKDGTMIDRIELNDDDNITIFIIAPGDEEYDETFDISEWDEYISKEDTTRIYKYLLKELNL